MRRTRTNRFAPAPIAAAAAVGLALVVLSTPDSRGAAGARASGVGTRGPSFLGTSTPTGTKRAETVVWWNDGSWWADMWDARDHGFRIFRLSVNPRVWVRTSALVDTRANTHADVLSTGAHLYVASHKFVRDTAPAVAGPPAYLYRYSYHARTGRYVLDRGFPSVINRYRTETLVIDKDSTGTIWATWQQDGRIYLNRTLDHTGRVWGAPFALPFADADVSLDDISALVAFGGRVGILWSNQRDGHDGFWFSEHRDGAPAGAWSAPEAALTGGRTADDHINLHAAAKGTVYAAVKTSNIDNDPLTLLLVRDRAGKWSSSVYGFSNACDNRPIVVIDEPRDLVRVFATGPAPAGNVCTTSGGAIYEKDASMDAPTFTPGRGRLVLNDPLAPFIHNVAASKRSVPAAQSLVVLAVNQKTSRYWTAYREICDRCDGGSPRVRARKQLDRSGALP